MGRIEEVEGDYLVHFREADVTKFYRHTPARLNEMADSLLRSQGQTSQAKFRRAEQMYGLTYCANGVLWDVELRAVARFPHTVYWDWKHNLLASGGVA